MRFKHCKIESILINTGLYASEECSTSDNFFIYFYNPHLISVRIPAKAEIFFYEIISHTKSYLCTIYDKSGKTKTYTGFYGPYWLALLSWRSWKSLVWLRRHSRCKEAWTYPQLDSQTRQKWTGRQSFTWLFVCRIHFPSWTSAGPYCAQVVVS